MTSLVRGLWGTDNIKEVLFVIEAEKRLAQLRHNLADIKKALKDKCLIINGACGGHEPSQPKPIDFNDNQT